MNTCHLNLPLNAGGVEDLRVGDRVTLTGDIYTARDAAHARLIQLITRGEPLPFPLEGQVIYYAGPAPARPPNPVGPIGPTTSYRMDPFTPQLLARGVRATIGKGPRSSEVKRAMQEFGAVYLAAVGGAAALLARTVCSAEMVAYSDLGPEAVRKLHVQRFPAVVATDSLGRDLYDRSSSRCT